jgi:prevent-host-death family protein
MREIQASETNASLPSLLDEVERGETLVITRDGRAVARLVPEIVGRREEIDRAIDEIKALQKRNGKISVDEILSARDEGRRF